MKLLIVEDNKMLARAIAKKVENSIDCTFDIAYDFNTAKELMEENDYFATLLDLCLPDAMHGEVVDYALEKKLPAIILTGLDDESTRKKFMDKPIVDYVLKDGSECVDYVIDTISRLKRNSHTKVIVAEDSMPTRNMIKNILQAYKFQVFPAAHGMEALNYLEQNPDIKLIITDKEMPAMGGEELLKEVRKEYSKNQLSLIVLTAHGNDEVAVRMLKSGANDFMPKPFSRENLICRVNNSVDLIFYLEQLKDNAEKDFLTKMKNRRSFFDATDRYYSSIGDETDFAVIMVDIDNFKQINDTLGHAAGDSIIIKCSNILVEQIRREDIASRFGGEEFCIMLKNISKEEAVKIAVKIRLAVKNSFVVYDNKTINFTVSVGVAMGARRSAIEDVIKKADEALYEAKKNGRDRVEIYSED